MLLLFVLMLTDFLLTYIGIALGVVQEGNPLLAWSFDLPYWQSLGLRILIVLLVFTPFVILYKMDQKVYKKVLLAAYIINFIVIMIHIHWILTGLG